MRTNQLSIKVDQLTFHYEGEPGDFELSIPALSIKSGELLAVFGPNGSGKTSLIRVLTGAIPAERGSVRWSNGTGTFIPVPGRDFVLTNLAGPFPHLTVEENLRLVGAVNGKNGRAADELLLEWQLTELRTRMPHQLSAGQAQRVVLARALATGASVYLLDEVTSAQSQHWAARIGEALQASASQGCVVVVISHDPVWVAKYARRIVELGEERPTQPSAQRFISRCSKYTVLYDGDAQRWPKLFEIERAKEA